MDWRSNFDERELKEITLCRHYYQQLGHGTTGHNRMVIIAKMVSILNNAESIINETDEEVEG
jgi:hypothetical protein